MSKILIIKSGHSETWINDTGDIVSFGDVFRTTTILQNFSGDEIVWIGSRESRNLLPDDKNFSFLEFNPETVANLNFPEFDLIINLEKNVLLKNISFDSYQKFCGFFFVADKNEWLLQNVGNKIFTLESWNDYCEESGCLTWGAKLNFLLESKPESSLGLIKKQSQEELFDFGLNWQVGKKWPSKQIGMEKWQLIYNFLTENYKVSWQEGFDSLELYQNWLSKNRVIITLDSLGMHLSLAMNKPTLAIFTATSSTDVDTNPHSYFYTPEAADINFKFIAESAIKLLNGK